MEHLEEIFSRTSGIPGKTLAGYLSVYFAPRGFRSGPQRPPDITPNFYYFEFNSKNEDVAVLYNREYNVATFSKPFERSWGRQTFIDHLELNSLIPDYMEVRILDRATLLQPISPRELAEKFPDYAYDAKYWKPGYVGEVVFNYWD